MTLCEVTDVAERVLEESTVQEYVETLVDYGVEPVDVGECWRSAAAYENEHAVALGDAIVLATAEWKGATALVGADADFQTAPDEIIERFRSESA